MLTQRQRDEKWEEQLRRIEEAVRVHRTGDGAMCHLKLIDEIQDASAIMEELLKPDPDATLWTNDDGLRACINCERTDCAGCL